MLRRLLESVDAQTTRDYEVVVTDDTPGDEAEVVCREFDGKFPLRYQHNAPALGSPENWNEGARLAQGRWIKLMHGDDWFADEHSLQRFADAARPPDAANFIFSAFYNVDAETGKRKKEGLPAIDGWLLRRSPFHLLRRNFIGHPSTTLVRAAAWMPYERSLKWTVDIEGYMRYLAASGGRFTHIAEPLVCLGIHPGQVTVNAFGVAEVEVPENLYLAREWGNALFDNFFAFDYFWRKLRRLGIRTCEELERHAAGMPIHPALHGMLATARRMPTRLWQLGPVSKAISAALWLAWRASGRRGDSKRAM